MPFEFGVPIDANFRETLRSRIRALLQPKSEGFPGSYPVHFEPSHLQLLADEEYFVTEKVAGVRYMLLSTHTPKGPACFLIDRHYEISFVPQLLLPLRDNPTKYQNDTLLDGEMVIENDGNKKSLRFLVFDLIALNGTSVTQKTYNTRLGMMDQDVLAVQASKTSEMRSKEPFTIERKPMQRSYGLNVILSGSKRHKHGGEGLIFVPVKQPYVPGISPKLLKWKSHTTAQFQIKVTLSKERKPLYCIHVKHGSGLKFYDYVTPEPPLAAEWHSSSPDGKIAEFWWDPQYQTQMFEKGYGLETRTGGWRFYRIREDKKDVDDEATLQAIVKGLDSLVTRQQLESQIDHIRTQWKAREAGTSSNGNAAQSTQSTQSTNRPAVRQLSISSSFSDNQPPPTTPSLNSPFLQSPSTASHSGSHGYFSKKDRERKSSVDEHGSTGSLPAATPGTFSHPLPPKPPPFQPRQSSVDQSQTQSTSANSHSTKAEKESAASTTSTAPPSTSASQTSDRKTTSPPPATTPTSAPPASGAAVKNPLKLSQVPAHLQPIKPWMTTSPAPRAPPSDRGIKAIRTERRDSKDSNASGGESSPRSSASTTPVSRKSSLSTTETTKDSATATPSIATKAKEPASSREGPSNSISNPTSASHKDQPQTPTPAHTPTPVGMPRSSVTPALPLTFSLPPTSIALPNSIPKNEEKKLPDEHQNAESSILNHGAEMTLAETSTASLTPAKPLVENGDSSSTPTPVLGKRTYGPSTSIGDQSEDSLAQRRKLSDGTLSSPRTEAVMTGIGTLNLIASQSPKPIHSSPLAAQDSKKFSPLLSPLSSPGAMAIGSDDKQSSPRPSHSSVPKFTASSKLLHEISVYPDPTLHENNVSEVEEEDQAMEVAPGLVQSPNGALEHKPHVAATAVIEDVEMREVDMGSAPLPTLALTHAEMMAYEPPSDQEKRQAIEKASAQAMYRIEKQGELQAAKESKIREDVERFKEKSRIRKEKAQKRKLQEVNEAPIQDRRAQPVRQINQQQGKQSNSDSTLLRGQSQDPQRLVYQTRQSKAAFRTEAQQSAQNSPKVQPRAAQYSGNTKEQVQSSQDSLSQPSVQRDQQATANDSDSIPPQERAEHQSHGISDQKMLEPGDTDLHHRRINSMDRQAHTSRAHNPPTPEQRGDIEQYSHLYTKRLDVGQHSDPNHRRSHSDIGVMYKTVSAAIAQPQSSVSGPFPVPGEPQVRSELEHRQGLYSSQNPSAPAPFRSDIDSPRMRNNVPFPTVTKEPVPTKLESKAKLQFILNDEDSGPDIDEDDARERRASPGRSNWGHDQDSIQRVHAQSEYSTRPDYSLQEHQGIFGHSNVPASAAEPESALALAHRQQSKKQKTAQEFGAMEQSLNHRLDEHEYHMRQSQMQSMASRPTTQQTQRPMPPADHWPQQVHSQHTHSPQPMPGGQSHPPNHAQAHSMVRRIPADTQGPPTQQSMSHPSARPMYQTSEQLQHGNPPGRPPHIDQYPMLGSGPAQDGPRPTSDRPTHSRHSSLSKPGIAPEHSHPQGLSYQNSLSKAPPAHSHADQFGRGYPPVTHPPLVQARSSAQAQLQQAQGQYHPQQQQQQQQQQAPAGTATRKNIPGEHHAGAFGPPQTSSAHPGYDSRPTHTQHLHPRQQQAIQQQQQQHLQHPPPNRHSEQEPPHDMEGLPGYHKQSQAPPQVRSGHNDQAGAPVSHGYYEHEGHGAGHVSGRSAMYGSQPLHPSAAQERQGVSYAPYRAAGTPHDQPYRPYPGGSARQPPGIDLGPKDDHVRSGSGGRGSMGHLPPEHSSLPHSSQRQQHSQHMSQHSQQLQQQQQQQQDYRHGSASFHQQQQQQQYPPQQKLMHVQDHPHSQYPPQHHQHNAPTKISSPRHPSEQHDPNYRHQIPHAQGHGHGHGGPSW